MEVLMMLIPLSVTLVFLAGGVYVWMQLQGQFDDLDAAGRSVITDDDAQPPPT